MPRRINLLCDRLLLFGYLEQKTELDGTSVDAVVADMRAEGLHGPAAVQPRPGPGQGPEAAPTGIGNGAGAEINALSRRLSELEQRPAAAAGPGQRSPGRDDGRAGHGRTVRSPTESIQPLVDAPGLVGRITMSDRRRDGGGQRAAGAPVRRGAARCRRG